MTEKSSQFWTPQSKNQDNFIALHRNVQMHRNGERDNGNCIGFLIDGYWVGHTKAWIIPGTEDMMPYITKSDKCKKWLVGTVGMAAISMIFAGIGML